MHGYYTIRFTNSLRVLLLGVLSLTFTLPLFAQNSPYSQLGLGTPVQSRHVLNMGMGGVSQAFSDGQSLNFVNPASFSTLKLTTFDIAFNVGRSTLRDQDSSSFGSGMGSVPYMELGVPLKKSGGWGFAFGLVPQTRVKYNLDQMDTSSTSSNIGGPAQYVFKGSGGSYKAFVGTGVSIKKAFRIGVNFGYLFGSEQNSSQTVYLDPKENIFNAHTRERIGYGTFFTDLGLQGTIKLSKRMSLDLGATGGLKNNMTGNKDKLMETFFFSGDPSDQAPISQDTVHFADDEKGSLQYPGHYGVGFLLRNTTSGNANWMIGADYETTQWSDFRSFASTETFQDNETFRVGAQFVPSVDPFNTSYWKGVAYRIGFHHSGGYFESNGTPVSSYAFSVGFGLPIRNFMRTNQYTMINTAIEFGKRGSKTNELSESFFKVSFGVSLSDIWFVPNKYR